MSIFESNLEVRRGAIQTGNRYTVQQTSNANLGLARMPHRRLNRTGRVRSINHNGTRCLVEGGSMARRQNSR